MSYPDGSVGWLVTGYALAQRVLTDRRFSARMELVSSPVRAEKSAPAPEGMFLYLDEPEHPRYRRPVAGEFTVRRIQWLAARAERIVTTELDRMTAQGPPVDLVREFAMPVPSRVICELLGVPYADHDAFQRWTHTMTSSPAPRPSRPAPRPSSPPTCST
jgi:cytochrome P450